MRRISAKRIVGFVLSFIMVISLVPGSLADLLAAVIGAQETKYYIQNNYLQGSYLYDDGGTLRFGTPAAADDTRYQWVVEDISGYKALKNASTGGYINVSGCEIVWNGTVKVGAFEEDNADYLWNFNITNGTTISSISNPGANISMATSESFPDRTEVECRNDAAAGWGTSKWNFVEAKDFVVPSVPSESGIYYIENNYMMGVYLYDDNGTLRFGYPETAADIRYQWKIEEVGASKALKNVSSQGYINVSGAVINWNGTVNVGPFAEGDDDYLWNFNIGKGIYISSVSNPGANISMATSESQSGRTEVECRGDGAAMWGTSKWDFVRAEDFSDSEPEVPQMEGYVNIQNSFYQLYMIEDNGNIIYGNTKRSNDHALWRITKDDNDLYAIQNKATGKYILPVTGTDRLQCIDSESPYYWTREAGRDGIVFGDSEANQGVDAKETYIKCIHMENKKGYAENSHIQKVWGTPQWVIKEYTEAGYKFIKAKDSDLYMYEDEGNNIKLGILNEEDSSYFWSVEKSGAVTYIKNRKTGHNITIEHIYGQQDRSLPLIGMTGETGWSSIKWNVEQVSGEENTYTIESGWDWYKDCIIHRAEPNNGNSYCNTDVTKADVRAQWVFEPAPELILEVEIPESYVRIKSSAASNFLYEIQSSQALVYGNNEEADLRSHWLIETSQIEGYYTIKNRVSERYISTDSKANYVRCIENEGITDRALWEVTFAEGTENILLRNKQNPLTYLNIGADAGYAQSTLVSTEAGTSQWVMQTAPTEGINPEGGSGDEVPAVTVVDTNKYHVKYNNSFVTVRQGQVQVESAADENAAWLVEYYNGEARVKSKVTGEYLYNQEGTLASKACNTDEEKRQVKWNKSEGNGTFKLTNGAITLTLVKAPDIAVYEASKAFERPGETIFTLFASKNQTYTVTTVYTSSQESIYDVKVNGSAKGNVTFPNNSGVVKSKTMEIALRKGINTIAFKAKSGVVTLGQLQIQDVNIEYRGATTTYTQYEAEQSSTNAQVLEDSRIYREFMSEASGRQAVKMDQPGNYVEFTLKEAANALVLRYCIPDSISGGGIQSTLSLYVNGQKQQALDLTSTYSWVYGSYPWSNTPDDKPHRFFDDSRFLLNQTYPAGTTIRLQKDAADTAAYYIIDLIETESVAPASAQPANSLSIASFGAVSGDGQDDTEALLKCIEEAGKLDKEVWIPAGVFHFNQNKSIPVSVEGTTIRGAGMWHTTLQGPGAGFMVQANNVSFYDFSVFGAETGRNDAEGRAAFESSNKHGQLSNLTIQNIWMEHVKVGVWTYFMDYMHVVGCRIRNTYADGINLCGGSDNSVVEQCQIRNTGDDAIAIWAAAEYGRYNSNNKIRFNTAGLQWLASSVAIYGGRNNEVTDNMIHDTVAFGSGINISANHNPVGFEGNVIVERNTLLRSGGHEYNYNQNYGAIWVYPVADMNVYITLKNNEIIDSTYQGISIIGGRNVKSISLLNNRIDTCGTWGIDIATGISGVMENINSTIRGNMINTLKNSALSSFTINSSVDNELAGKIYPSSPVSAQNDGRNGIEVPAVPVSALIVTGQGGITSIMTKGGTLQMIASVLPNDADNKEVIWSIEGGSEYASISANGILTAKADGTVTVKASSVSTPGVSAACQITISGNSSSSGGGGGGSANTGPAPAVTDSNKDSQEADSSKDKQNGPEKAETVKVNVSLTNGMATRAGVNIQLTVKPYIQNGRTMAGVRDIANLLGIENKSIVWNPSDKTIAIKTHDRVMQLVINQKYAIVNGKKIDLDVAPQIKDGRTVLPVAQIARILGIEVKFEEQTKEVIFNIIQ